MKPILLVLIAVTGFVARAGEQPPEDCIDYVVRSELNLGGRADSVVADGEVVYVWTRDAELFSVDVSDPEQPVVLDHIGLDGIAFLDMLVIDDYLFVGSGDTLHIIDTHDPASLSEVREIVLDDAIVHLRTHAGFLYALLGRSGTEILDVKDPSDPVVAGRLQVHDSGADHNDLSFYGDVGYIAAGIYGVDIMDFEDLTHPVLLGTYKPFFSNSEYVTLRRSGDTLYLGTVNDSPFLTVGAFDVSKPAAPSLLENSYFLVQGFGTDNFYVDGEYVHFVTVGRITSFRLDEGDVAAMRTSSVPRGATQMSMRDSRAYIANGDWGLMVLDVDTECPRVCWADLNGDGRVDYFDLSLWVPAYLNQLRSADIDNNGLIQTADILAMIEALGSGCP